MKHQGKLLFLFLITFVSLSGLITGTAYAQETRIGDTVYPTLAAAVNAAQDGQTIELLDNVTPTGQITINGKKITIQGSFTITSNVEDLFNILSTGGELTLQDVTVNAINSVIYAHDGGIVNINGTKITVTNSPNVGLFATGQGSKIVINEGSDINQTGTDVVTLSIKNGAAAEINGGTLSNGSSSTMAATGTNSQIIINDGSISTTANMVVGYSCGQGKIIVNGGTITSKIWLALSAIKFSQSNGGEVVINGGTINGAVGAYEDPNSKLTITGGTIHKNDQWGVYVAAGASGTITDGMIYGYVQVSNENGTLDISGGTFEIDPQTYIHEGYSKKDNGDGTYTVVKNPTVEQKPQGTTLTYNGTDQNLVENKPLVTGGTIQYKVGEGGTYSSENPTGKDAGEYTVSWYVKGDDGYGDLGSEDEPAGTFTSTIEKANINPTVSIKGWTYGAAANSPSVSGNPGNGTVTYSYKVMDADDSTYSNIVPTDAGDYTVKAEIAATQNYNAGSAVANFTIQLADPSIITPPQVINLVYNGNAQNLVSAGEAEDGLVIEDSLDGETWSEDIPTATNAGDYTVYYRTKADENHKAGETYKVKASIGQLEVNLSWDSTEFTYDGTEQGPTAEVSGLLDGDKDTVTLSITGKGTNAGDYIAKAKIVFTPANYELAENSETEKAYTIGKADILESDFTAPLKIDGLVYNGSEQELFVSGEWKNETLGTFLYNLNSYEPKAADYPTEFSAAIPTGIDAGIYNGSYYIEGDNNHNNFGSEDEALPLEGEITANNTPKPLDPSMIIIEPQSVTYNGRPQTVTVIVLNGNIMLVEGVDYIIDEESQLSATMPGTYTVKIRAVEGNPNFTGEASATWTIQEQERNEEGFTFYRIGDQNRPFCQSCSLPATGFSTRVNKPLSVRPNGLEYAELNMRIQIPTLGVDTELVGVPESGDSWAIEWLGYQAGLLSGSFVPGEGYSYVAAHNHLNESEIGPFLMLSQLGNNDLILVNNTNGEPLGFKVFANELLKPNDMRQVVSIAEKEDNTLVLITCENESVDGGYLNRRVVFAKPVF